MLGYGYCRYSSHMQDEKSIEQQKMEIEEYSQRNNIQIVKYYIDEAKTGTKNDRDGFQEMISDACKNKEIECVLVWKTDRFARNTQDSLMFRRQLAKHGTKLISITQPIDESTPEGKLMSVMMAGIDEYYSENLASNIRRAQKLKAKNCEFNGGIAPLGFDIVDKHYVINEKEANAVKKIFELYLSGYGLLDIAVTLNSLGYTTKKGKAFGKNSIYEILGNEKYIGNYIFNKGYKRNTRIRRDDIIIIEDVIPQIISKEDFEKVKELRNSHSKVGGAYSAKNVYLLSGLIVCGRCGSNYIGRTSTKVQNNKKYKTGYYSCSNRNKLGKCTALVLKQQELEDAIINLLTERLLNSCEIENLVKKVNEQYRSIYASSFEKIEQLKQQIKERQEQISNITIALSHSPNSSALLDKLQQLEDIKSMLEEQLRMNTNINKTPVFTADLVKNILKKDTDKLVKNVESKEIVKKWIKKIEVNDNEIIVHFLVGNHTSLPRMVARDRLILRLRIDIQNIKSKSH